MFSEVEVRVDGVFVVSRRRDAVFMTMRASRGGFVLSRRIHDISRRQYETTRNEVSKMKKFISANEEIVHKQDAEIRRLASMIRRMDDDALTQRKEYDSVINERDILGAQLIRRNDEIGLLQEKLKIQHSTLTRGEEQYSARVHDVQVLRLKIRDMQREVAVASGGW